MAKSLYKNFAVIAFIAISIRQLISKLHKDKYQIE